MPRIDVVSEVISFYDIVGRINCDYCGAYKGPVHVSGPISGATTEGMNCFSSPDGAFVVNGRLKGALRICDTHKWEKDEERWLVKVNGGKGEAVYPLVKREGRS